MMTPAERYAALKTLEVAVKEVSTEAAAEAIEHGSATGADRWRTRYGTVVIATREDAPVVADEAGLLAWAKENAPGEVMESVRPAFVKTLMARCVVEGDAEGDEVVDTASGEVLPFAMVRRGTVYVTTPKAEAKEKSVAAWEDLLRSRLDAIAADSAKELP